MTHSINLHQRNAFVTVWLAAHHHLHPHPTGSPGCARATCQRQPHISSTTAQAWSMDDNIIIFDGRFCLPTSSALQANLLETPCGRSDHLQLLAVGLHTPLASPSAHYTFPSSVLMGREWPQCILSRATMVFSSMTLTDSSSLLATSSAT